MNGKSGTRKGGAGTMETVEIVLVEDNESDVELTLDALKANRLTNNVKVLRDGQEALDYIFEVCGGEAEGHAKCPHLVLLDLKLPKIDGLEVLARLRENEQTRLIPVVVLTSSSEEKDRIESYKLGVNSFIVKPVDFDDFTRVVAEIGLYWVLLNRPPF